MNDSFDTDAPLGYPSGTWTTVSEKGESYDAQDMSDNRTILAPKSALSQLVVPSIPSVMPRLSLDSHSLDTTNEDGGFDFDDGVVSAEINRRAFEERLKRPGGNPGPLSGLSVSMPNPGGVRDSSGYLPTPVSTIPANMEYAIADIKAFTPIFKTCDAIYTKIRKSRSFGRSIDVDRRLLNAHYAVFVSLGRTWKDQLLEPLDEHSQSGNGRMQVIEGFLVNTRAIIGDYASLIEEMVQSKRP